MIRKMTLCILLGGMPLALGACGGCGGDNKTTNNTTTADMGDVEGEMGGECTPGEAGCACTMEGTCSGDNACVNGMCEGAQSSGLTITGAEAARSCEILLEEQANGRVLGATYADGVKGAWRRHAPNVAFAITSTSDTAFPAGAVSVQFADGGTLPAVSKVTCFDASGATIDGAAATLK